MIRQLAGVAAGLMVVIVLSAILSMALALDMLGVIEPDEGRTAYKRRSG